MRWVPFPSVPTPTLAVVLPFRFFLSFPSAHFFHATKVPLPQFSRVGFRVCCLNADFSCFVPDPIPSPLTTAPCPVRAKKFSYFPSYPLLPPSLCFFLSLSFFFFVEPRPIFSPLRCSNPPLQRAPLHPLAASRPKLFLMSSFCLSLRSEYPSPRPLVFQTFSLLRFFSFFCPGNFLFSSFSKCDFAALTPRGPCPLQRSCLWVGRFSFSSLRRY